MQLFCVHFKHSHYLLVLTNFHRYFLFLFRCFTFCCISLSLAPSLCHFISCSDNSIGPEAIIPIEVQTLLASSNRNDNLNLLAHETNDTSSANVSIDSIPDVATATALPAALVVQAHNSSNNGHIENNLAMQQPSLITVDNAKDAITDEKDIMLEWHRNKPSIWQQYYGSKRLKYSNMVKKIKGKFDVNSTIMSYVSTNNSIGIVFFSYLFLLLFVIKCQIFDFTSQ